MTDPDQVWVPPAPGTNAERSRLIEAGDIEAFAAISGDRNPIHFDERAAAASRFGEIEARADKPVTKLKTTVTRDDGVVVGEGTATCYASPLG
jgi:MaoC like domain